MPKQVRREVGATMQAKADQKALVAAKKEEHEALLWAGVNGPMKQQIAKDELLCTVCGATQLGPMTKCECPGGRTKPTGWDDYITVIVPHLVAAAKGRHWLKKDWEKQDHLKNQAQVAADRTKRKEAKIGADWELEVIGDGGTEILVAAEFPIGKLGMTMEKTAVSAVSEAAELGVKKGWVVYSINGTMITKDAGDGSAEAVKKAIQKEVVACFKKEQKPCMFKFRAPIKEGEYLHCILCDKFLEAGEFGEEQVEAGPGKQMCAGCEEFGDCAFE